MGFIINTFGHVDQFTNHREICNNSYVRKEYYGKHMYHIHRGQGRGGGLDGFD